MLKTIRAISAESNLAGATRTGKILRFGGKIVFVLYLLLFVSDTINIDVLTAALKGDITFVDDSSISDSLFDTGSIHHSSAFDNPIHLITHQVVTKDHRHIASDNIVKNVITEDEDSPGIADALLSSAFSEQGELPRPESEQCAQPSIQILDRTISYQRILI